MATASAVRRTTAAARTSTRNRPTSNDNEVDEAAVRVDAVQAHPDAIANVEPLLTAHHAPFHRRRCDANVRPFVRRAGYQRVERVANSRFDQHRGCRFPDL